MNASEDGPDPEGDEQAPCDRCGAIAPGWERWMFHSSLVPGREFHCSRCIAIMRMYAVVGFGLLGLLLAAFCVALWWLARLR